MATQLTADIMGAGGKCRKRGLFTGDRGTKKALIQPGDNREHFGVKRGDRVARRESNNKQGQGFLEGDPIKTSDHVRIFYPFRLTTSTDDQMEGNKGSQTGEKRGSASTSLRQ